MESAAELNGEAMAPGLQLEHPCPQCGAPLVLEETDRLIRCGYCRVNSYLTTPDLFHYVLPHRAPDRELVYFPYYRFRGTLFICATTGVEFRLVDASLPGQATSYFPPSVGVRAQTQKLRFAAAQTPGTFLALQVARGVVPEIVYKRFGRQRDETTLHQEFIGDTTSVIFAPFYIHGKLFDAITRRAVSRVLPDTFAGELESSSATSRDVSFIASVCPQCGWDLEGERDSLVLVCRNCDSGWRSGAASFEQVPMAHIPAPLSKALAGTGMYLPFWQIAADITGIELKNYRDLVRVANLAKVLPGSEGAGKVLFWTPAFKVRPRMFLGLSRTLTLTQVALPLAEGLPAGAAYPVTLPAAEAMESIKVLIASFLKPVEHLPQLLPGLRTRPRSARLVFLPFTAGHHEWQNPDLHLSIPRPVLRHAANL